MCPPTDASSGLTVCPAIPGPLRPVRHPRYAAAAVLQERIAARAASANGSARSAGAAVVALLSRGSGWAAVALNVLGAALHVAALRYGPLILVQPLGALTVVLAVPLGAAAAGRRTGPAERRGVALTLLGLAGLVLATSPAAAAGALDPGEALLLGAATAAAVVAITAFGPGRFAYAALAAGARGVLTEAGGAELLAAVRTVRAGGAVLSPGLTRRLIDTWFAGPGVRASTRTAPGRTR